MITDKVRAEMRYYAETGDYSDAARYEQFALDCKLDQKGVEIGKVAVGLARVHWKPVEILETASATGLTAAGVTAELTKEEIEHAYTSLDIEPNLLAYAKERNRGDRFVRGDFENLPFADGSFDIYIMMGAEGYRTRGQFYAEVYRVLGPGGYYLMPQIGPSPLASNDEILAARSAKLRVFRFDKYMIAKKD